MYNHQRRVGPVMSPDNGLSFRLILRLAGTRWRYLSRLHTVDGVKVIKSKLSYDRRSIGQSVLASVILLWGTLSDDRTSMWFTRTIATGPCQRCHSRVQVPQNFGPYLTVSFETWFPFCRFLRLAGLRWSYSNWPSHAVCWVVAVVEVKLRPTVSWLQICRDFVYHCALEVLKPESVWRSYRKGTYF
jgi:hypothetical protein